VDLGIKREKGGAQKEFPMVHRTRNEAPRQTTSSKRPHGHSWESFTDARRCELVQRQNATGKGGGAVGTALNYKLHAGVLKRGKKKEKRGLNKRNRSTTGQCRRVEG